MLISLLELLDYLGEFVEVVINMILYTREVYPASNQILKNCTYVIITVAIFTRVKRFNVTNHHYIIITLTFLGPSVYY